MSVRSINGLAWGLFRHLRAMETRMEENHIWKTWEKKLCGNLEKLIWKHIMEKHIWGKKHLIWNTTIENTLENTSMGKKTTVMANHYSWGKRKNSSEMPFMTNWIMVNVAHGSPTMNSSTPWPYNASRKAAPGWGLPKSSKSWMTILVLKPCWNLWWLGDLPFFKIIYIYIYISIIIYPTKIIGFMWPRLGPIQQAVLIVNMLLAHNTRMKYLFPKSVSYVQRAGKRLNANNCSCTAICPNKVYPNILLEYPKRTNATIREGGKTLIC